MSILTLEVIEPFTVKEHGQVSSWQVGQRMALSPEKAQRVLDRVGDKVRIVEPDAIDFAIGTVVEASMEFLTDAGERVVGTGPWIVTDVVAVEHEPRLLSGRWLLLSHGSNRQWSHESTTTVYHCPNCKGARCWWSAHTVLCIQCTPPSLPACRELWRELAALTVGITADDRRYASLLDALQVCDEMFKLGDYAGFQTGVMRVRRVAHYRPLYQSSTHDRGYRSPSAGTHPLLY
jgi:hypothetical protein